MPSVCHPAECACMSELEPKIREILEGDLRFLIFQIPEVSCESDRQYLAAAPEVVGLSYLVEPVVRGDSNRLASVYRGYLKSRRGIEFAC